MLTVAFAQLEPCLNEGAAHLERAGIQIDFLIGHSLGAAVAVGAPQLSARAREDAPNRVPAMSTGIAARLCEEAAAPAVSLLLEGSPPPHGPRGRLSRARGISREMAREQAPSPPFLTRPPIGSRWHRTRPRQ